MKQYKLNAWPDLPPRFEKTVMRRVVSELTQRFGSTRDLARSCGASQREVEELVAKLMKDGMLMMRDAPLAVSAAQSSWREWWPVAAAINAVRGARR